MAAWLPAPRGVEWSLEPVACAGRNSALLEVGEGFGKNGQGEEEDSSKKWYQDKAAAMGTLGVSIIQCFTLLPKYLLSCSVEGSGSSPH